MSKTKWNKWNHWNDQNKTIETKWTSQAKWNNWNDQKFAKKKKKNQSIIIKWMPGGVRCYLLIAIGLAWGVEETFIKK